MSETNVEPTNCLYIIEQLRHDRDKYLGMWRSQCNIAEEVMKERDCLTEELAKASTIANNNYEVILKCNRQINDLQRELARYRNGEEG